MSCTPPLNDQATSDELCHRPPLERTHLIRLSRIAPIRLLACVAWEWILIVSAVAGALWAANVWATLAAVVLIGTRQHALLVLMHEFSHRQFSRTRHANLGKPPHQSGYSSSQQTDQDAPVSLTGPNL